MIENNVIIKTDNLVKKFKKTVAVDGLNLTVRKGEIFGLVGPDGAGKTTTIRMLAAVMNPTSGRATVAGYDTVKKAEPIKRIIGYMPQRFSLYGDLTVMENINFFADIFGVRGRERKERTQQLLEFSRLERFQNRQARQLSGGMQKKLGLACTLIHKPEIIYLDEPTTGVDPVSRREFWDILTDLHLQGVTLLISTPYMDEAERCSRVGLMYSGNIIVCDTPAKIKGLVRGELIELRPNNMNRASEVVAGLKGTLEVQTYGDLLHVFVDSAERRVVALQDALNAAGIEITGLRQTRPRMEEAFISLITRQQTGEEWKPEGDLSTNGQRISEWEPADTKKDGEDERAREVVKTDKGAIPSVPDDKSDDVTEIRLSLDAETWREQVRELVAQESPERVAHCERVYALARELDTERTADDDVLYAAAWLHTAAPTRGAVAERALDELGFTEMQRAAVLEAIAQHRPEDKPGKQWGAVLLREAYMLDMLGIAEITRQLHAVTGAAAQEVYGKLREYCDVLPDKMLTRRGAELAVERAAQAREVLESWRAQI